MEQDGALAAVPLAGAVGASLVVWAAEALAVALAEAAPDCEPDGELAEELAGGLPAELCELQPAARIAAPATIAPASEL